MNMEQLLFRRQFFLSPQKITMFPSWISEDLPGGYHLTVHPDLNITRFKNENLEIILLGYILDPYSPMFIDLELIKKRITGVF
jgi:hypothetical protein